MTLLPIYKWTGWKRKEIKTFEKYYPDFVKENRKYTLIEPFFWGWAVYWNLNNIKWKNIINDIDFDLVNFLQQVKENNEILKEKIEDVKVFIQNISNREKEWNLNIKEAKEERWKIYYEWRNKDRKDGLKELSNIDRAFRFLLVNQLAFNWMRRFNSKWEFNIPYGNYKSFNPNILKQHIDLLNNTEIHNWSYKKILEENDKENTFIYLDPPYTREFKEYSHDNIFWEEQQIELFNIFKNLKKAKAMIIINKDDFTSNLYKDYIKEEYSLKYSTNIKNRYDNNVKHLIITNY